MDSRLYEIKLANHKIFKDIKESLPEKFSGKLKNLLELRDDVLYLWSSIENCLLSLNLQHFEKNGYETTYQVIIDCETINMH